jgi:hypothetical protein
MKFERKIIALCGRAQHGKSTLARQIAAYYGAENVAVTAFATVPKRMLRVFGLTEDELRGNSKGTPRVILGGQTPRYAMQTLATEWGRNMLYDEVWVDAWERDLVEWPSRSSWSRMCGTNRRSTGSKNWEPAWSKCSGRI